MPMNKNHEDVKLLVGEEIALQNLEPATIGLNLLSSLRVSGKCVSLFVPLLSYAHLFC